MKHLLVAAFLLIASSIPSLMAQTKLEVQPSDTIASVLQRHIGQPIELRLRSGEKVGGKLEKVNEKLAHMSQLTGAEFFDAVVALEDIAAVVVRAKAK